MNQSNALPPIIIIDDSEDDLFFVTRLLKKAGAKRRIMTFKDAADVVRYLTSAAETHDAENIPCLVFTDLKMPGMSGIQFVEWLRAQKNLNRLPVFMLTTSDDPADLRAGTAAGVDGYFVKFPTTEQICELLRAHAA